jgi:hypothetical protein
MAGDAAAPTEKPASPAGGSLTFEQKFDAYEDFLDRSALARVVRCTQGSRSLWRLGQQFGTKEASSENVDGLG